MNTALTNSKSSFLEATMITGIASQKLTPEKVSDILESAPSGIIQIANVFETPHLRSGIEASMHRMVTLISLYLEYSSNGDVNKAVDLLISKNILDLSRLGSDMIKELIKIMKEVSDFPNDEEIRKTAYDFFASPTPILLNTYKEKLRNYENKLALKKFTIALAESDKNLMYVTFLEDAQEDAIILNIFPYIITGKTLESEQYETIMQNKYYPQRWQKLLNRFNNRFPVLCDSFSFAYCFEQYIKSIDHDEIKITSQQDEIEAKDKLINDTWDKLWTPGDGRSRQKQVSAIFSGLVLGNMKTSISHKEIVTICNAFISQEYSWEQVKNYIHSNVPEEYGLGNYIEEYGMSKHWRDLMGKKSLIKRVPEKLKVFFNMIK